MGGDQKRPGLVFWVTALVAVCILYGASFGPSCWISSRTGIGARLLPVIYRPITMAMKLDSYFVPPGPWPSNATVSFNAAGILNNYAKLWAARNGNWSWRWVVEIPNGGDLKMSEGHWRWDATEFK
jgi:hypothetical protein